MWARLDQTEELIELAGVNRVEFVAVFALDLNRAFHEQSFEEQFMARSATILGEAIRHRLSFKSSLEGGSGKGMRTMRKKSLIHNR